MFRQLRKGSSSQLCYFLPSDSGRGREMEMYNSMSGVDGKKPTIICNAFHLGRIVESSGTIKIEIILESHSKDFCISCQL